MQRFPAGNHVLWSRFIIKHIALSIPNCALSICRLATRGNLDGVVPGYGNMMGALLSTKPRFLHYMYNCSSIILPKHLSKVHIPHFDNVTSTLRRQRHVHVEKAHALCSGTSTVIPPETAAKEECWAKTLSSQSCLVHEQTSAQIVPTLHHTKPTYTMSWRDLGSTHTTLSRVRKMAQWKVWNARHSKRRVSSNLHASEGS